MGKLTNYWELLSKRTLKGIQLDFARLPLLSNWSLFTRLTHLSEIKQASIAEFRNVGYHGFDKLFKSKHTLWVCIALWYIYPRLFAITTLGSEILCLHRIQCTKVYSFYFFNGIFFSFELCNDSNIFWDLAATDSSHSNMLWCLTQNYSSRRYCLLRFLIVCYHIAWHVLENWYLWPGPYLRDECLSERFWCWKRFKICLIEAWSTWKGPWVSWQQRYLVI